MTSKICFIGPTNRRKYFGNKIAPIPADSACNRCLRGRAKYAISKKCQRPLRQKSAAAAEAKENGVPNFGIVYSGRAVTESELARLETLITRITRDMGLGACAALGIIDADQARRLAAAGLTRYNHNLETSERHFRRIVTTHAYSDRIAAIRAAQSAGLGICAGGIFGVGETDRDRIDMALTLRDLAVDTVPMNFLHPIPGTPLAYTPPLPPRQILTIIALIAYPAPPISKSWRPANLHGLQS